MKKSSSVPSVAGVLDGGGCRKHIDERFASSLVGTQRRRSRKPYEQNWVPTTASCRMKQQGTLQQVCSRKCASSTSCRIHEASAFSLQQTLSHVRCFACQPATRAQDFDFRAHGKCRIDLPIQRCVFRYLFPHPELRASRLQGPCRSGTAAKVAPRSTNCSSAQRSQPLFRRAFANPALGCTA